MNSRSTQVRPAAGAAARGAFAAHLDAGRTILGERDARVVLGDAVPFGPAIECRDADEAERAAIELGFPVVIKALSPAALHKSDHGLVRTGCADAAGVRAAAAELIATVTALDGAPFVLSVQQQLAGVEIAIGIRRDELGALCVVSAGGTLIELLGDVATAMAPVDRTEALALLRSLRSWPLLEGYRGEAGADVDAVADLVVAVSELADAVPELVELDLNPVFAGPDGVAVADARCVLATPDAPTSHRDGGSSAVRAVLEPQRIAIVGASADTTKVGGLVLRYLRKHDWPGEIVAINRKPVDVEGVRTYASLRDVPDPVDVACIAVPAAAVEGVVEDCVAAGVPAGVIFTAGFAEVGDEGLAAQTRLVELAGDRFRFVGPNTIGVASPISSMFATFGMGLEGASSPGAVGFVSQSGAIVSALVSRSAEFSVGFSHWISAGNEADLGVADYVEYLVEDERTSVICLFLEVIRQPAAFAAACARARAAGKPILAVKTGRSEAGREAAISHTGALAGSDAAYDAFLRRCGVVRLPDLPGLLGAAQGLLSIGAVPGKRVIVVSMSGGACSLLADACADAGLTVPPLSASLRERLRDVIPSFGGVRNPIDITAAGISSPDLVRRTMEVLCAATDEADLVLLQLSTNADPAAAHMARDLLALREQPGLPFLLGRLGSPSLAPDAMRIYADAGMHVFSWPGQLVDAARACVHHGAHQRQRSSREP